MVFGYFAGVAYWFPKVMGFRLHEGLGKLAFGHWITGFFVTFMPMYALGLMGMTRRTSQYDAETGWQPLLIISFVGALIMGGGLFLQVVQIGWSWWKRDELRDGTGDPWEGRTLEWSLPSPPPPYNFAHIPTVRDRDDYWESKRDPSHPARVPRPYVDIHMPSNSGYGFLIAHAAFVMGFALVWHIHWLALVSIAGIVGMMLARSARTDHGTVIPAAEVERIENELKKGISA